jgi:hypothetical protein
MTQRPARALAPILALILLVTGILAFVRVQGNQEAGKKDDSRIRWLSKHYENHCGHAGKFIDCRTFGACVANGAVELLKSTSCDQTESLQSHTGGLDVHAPCLGGSGYIQHEAVLARSCFDAVLPQDRSGWTELFSNSLRALPGTEFFTNSDQREGEIHCVADTLWDLAESEGCNGVDMRKLRVDLGHETITVDERLLVRVESCVSEAGSDARESIAIWWRSLLALWRLGRAGETGDAQQEPTTPQMLRDLTGQVCPLDLSPKVDPNTGWYFFQTPDARFSILLPALPKSNVYSVQTPDGPLSTAIFHSAPDTSTSFQLSMVAYPRSMLERIGKVKLLEDARKLALRNGNATVQDEKEIEVDANPGYSLRARISLPNDAFSEMQMQLFFARDIQIQLLYLAPRIDGRAASRFFESFHSIK